MGRYEGLDGGLKMRVSMRDGFRCRWCGRTNARTDPHHIRYRRSSVDDTIGNLILLCRRCHDFVHGAVSPSGSSISKGEAQDLLFDLVNMPGVTGLALWRQRRKARQTDGTTCVHGKPTDVGKCQRCLAERSRGGAP